MRQNDKMVLDCEPWEGQFFRKKEGVKGSIPTSPCWTFNPSEIKKIEQNQHRIAAHWTTNTGCGAENERRQEDTKMLGKKKGEVKTPNTSVVQGASQEPSG